MTDPLLLKVRGAAYPSATLAAHLLSSAGSELSRAADLLELAGWGDEHTIQILRQARDRVQGIRLVVDGEIDRASYTSRGLEVPEHVHQAIDLGEGMISP